MLSVIMLSRYAEFYNVECSYAEYHYSQCHYAKSWYAECRYDERRGTVPFVAETKKII